MIDDGLVNLHAEGAHGQATWSRGAPPPESIVTFGRKIDSLKGYVLTTSQCSRRRIKSKPLYLR
jgi:hypothetical protein